MPNTPDDSTRWAMATYVTYKPYDVGRVRPIEGAPAELCASLASDIPPNFDLGFEGRLLELYLESLDDFDGPQVLVESSLAGVLTVGFARREQDLPVSSASHLAPVQSVTLVFRRGPDREPVTRSSYVPADSSAPGNVLARELVQQMQPHVSLTDDLSSLVPKIAPILAMYSGPLLVKYRGRVGEDTFDVIVRMTED